MLVEFNYAEQETVIAEVKEIAKERGYTQLSNEDYVERVFNLVVNEQDTQEYHHIKAQIENDPYSMSEDLLDTVSTMGYTLKEMELMRYSEYQPRELEKLPVGWVFL